jgi:hypothetical protein
VTSDGLTDLCLDVGIVPGPSVVGSEPIVTWSSVTATEAIQLLPRHHEPLPGPAWTSSRTRTGGSSRFCGSSTS